MKTIGQIIGIIYLMAAIGMLGYLVAMGIIWAIKLI